MGHRIAPTFQCSSSLQFHRLAGIFLLDVFENLRAQGDVGDALTGVVLVKSDLLRVVRPSLKPARISPISISCSQRDAALDRVENIGLLVLDRLLNRYDPVHMALSESRVVDSRRLAAVKPPLTRPTLLPTIVVTCCPARSQLPSNTGTLELVAVNTISTPRTASSGEITGVIYRFVTGPISSANCFRFAGLRL